MYQFETELSKRKKKRFMVKTLSILLIILAVVAFVYYMLMHYKVVNIYVDGNVHYTSDEIKEIVMEGPLGDNSLYLSLKYKNKELKDVPFVDTIQVTIISNDTIRISVYEKALAGYVEYLGKYMYFDKDGTVVESSNVKTEGICQITGLSFDFMVLGKPLPVEDETIFKKILSTNQLLTKYSLDCRRMDFGPGGGLTLYFGDVRAEFGSSDDLDEKIMRLPKILPSLEGKKGVLDMKDKTGKSESIIFLPDNLTDD